MTNEMIVQIYLLSVALGHMFYMTFDRVSNSKPLRLKTAVVATFILMIPIVNTGIAIIFGLGTICTIMNNRK